MSVGSGSTIDAVGAAAAAGEATASVEVAFWALPDPVVTSWESSPPSPPEPEPEPEPPEEPPPEEPALEPPGQPRRAPRSPQGVVVVVVVDGGTVVVVVVVVVDAAGLLAADDTGGVLGGVVPPCSTPAICWRPFWSRDWAVVDPLPPLSVSRMVGMSFRSGSKNPEDGLPHSSSVAMTVAGRPEEWLATMRRQMPASRSRRRPAM